MEHLFETTHRKFQEKNPDAISLKTEDLNNKYTFNNKRYKTIRYFVKMRYFNKKQYGNNEPIN